MRQEIELTVNGRTYELSAEPRKTLLAVLRDQLQLTGTKEGCSTGDCGACTVLLDGDAVTSCLVLAVQANGREITTVEGIASRGKLHPVQKAMVESGGLQCGFCTAGIVVAGVAMMEANDSPTEDEIRQGLAGNLCVRMGYGKTSETTEKAEGERVGEALGG